MTVFKEDRSLVAFNARDLEAIDARVYEAKRDELTARTLIALKTDISPGDETYSYDYLTRRGAAIILANNANDVPLVDIGMTRETVTIKSIVLGFKTNVQELRQSAKTGFPIETEKAAAARRGIAEKENKLVWVGDPDYNITGVFNKPGIQVLTVPTNADGNTSWDLKTPEEILEDLRIGQSLIRTLPGMSTAPLNLVLPANKMQLLTKNFNQFNTRSILDIIRDKSWFDSITVVPDMATVGINNSASFGIFNADDETMQIILPMDIMRHDPEWAFPNWKTVLEERCGGVIVRYPKAVLRGDGI